MKNIFRTIKEDGKERIFIDIRQSQILKYLCEEKTKQNTIPNKKAMTGLYQYIFFKWKPIK